MSEGTARPSAMRTAASSYRHAMRVVSRAPSRRSRDGARTLGSWARGTASGCASCSASTRRHRVWPRTTRRRFRRDRPSWLLADAIVRRDHRLEERRVDPRLVRALDEREEILGQALAAEAALVGEHEGVALADPRIEEPELAQLVVVDAHPVGDVEEFIAEGDLRREERVL